MAFSILLVLGTIIFHATPSYQIELNIKKLDGEFIDISAKGNHLWGVFCNGTVVRANLNADGSFESWTLVSTTGIPATEKPVGIGASPDGWSWLLTNTLGNNIWRYNVDTKAWQNLVGSNADQISAASNVMLISTVHTGDTYWAKNTDLGLEHHGVKGRWTSFGTDKSRWWIDFSGRPRLCAFENNAWCTAWEIKCLRGVATVEAHTKDRAVFTSDFGEVNMWDGKKFSKLPTSGTGKATRASVTERFVYWLNENGDAYYSSYQ